VAQGQTFNVLYNFTGGSDGGYLFDSLIRDAAGNLYGTTRSGGASGDGTVFMLDTSGTETVLYSFSGVPDGARPYASLIRDPKGHFCGTTFVGGSESCSNQYGSGCGTVFDVDKAGKETVLYSFTGTGTDGVNPLAGVVRGPQGALYGTTAGGGASGYGTVFKLVPNGKEIVLYGFTGTGGDGATPEAGLLRDGKGNLYGVTYGGGTSGDGTVFMLDKTGKETVLYSFGGSPDGANPSFGYLIRDAKGNLYGTTENGGAYDVGTVFKLTPGGKETVLHSFDYNGTDGGAPATGLIRDAKGNLYGTTSGGGASGWGTVFMLDKTGNETVLHSFTGSDGEVPFGSLLRDPQGNLYGTTFGGGSGGYGVVFELTP
jgi:uncharacterized repeat protein (TIGR03803 family)